MAALQIVQGAAAVIGILDTIFGSDPQEEYEKELKKQKRKAKNAVRNASDASERDAINRNRTNTAASKEAAERRARQMGIFGTSAGQAMIEKAGLANAEQLNKALSQIDINELHQLAGIETNFMPRPPQPGEGEGGQRLMEAGLNGLLQKDSKGVTGFETLFQSIFGDPSTPGFSGPTLDMGSAAVQDENIGVLDGMYSKENEEMSYINAPGSRKNAPVNGFSKANEEMGFLDGIYNEQTGKVRRIKPMNLKGNY